ncbi:MAG: ABC transporter substrate-binding protein [Bacteroidia bacterium]|nr:ABC transporter substrate-binding protein [Bacteroidia bacterium]
MSIICLLLSCDDNVGADNFSATGNSENLLDFASFVEITNYKSGYYIKVLSPWSNDDLGEFYLYPDSLRLPDELEKCQVIRTPVNSVVTYSSTQWSVFLQLDEIQRVKGILESSFTKNVEIKNLMAEGKIKDVGIETQINVEKVIEIQPDVILYTPYSTIPKTDIGELTGAVMFPFADYLENHPLGRAEWLKVIGYLTCREKDTDKWFDNIVTNYESIKSLCDSVKNKPSVFSDLPYEGQWYVPGGKSYIARIFKDAGAEYVWNENNSTASQPIDAETVLAKAGDADYWRIMNSTDFPYSYKRLSIENELYTHFNAFKEKHVIVCDVMKTSYFEKSQYQPDFLLKDFVKIFHPELIEEDYEPQFYYLLNE